MEVIHGMFVTREQLATALDHLWVYAKNREGTYHGQIIGPGQVADDLWENLAAALREPGPKCTDAGCGYCGPDDDVVDAHIHCEHAPASRAAYELEQADQIVAILGRMPDRHVRRVMRFVWDYLTDDDAPPF